MPGAWLERTSATPGSAETVDRLSPDGRASEYLMFALRLREGASLSRYAALAGSALPEAALKEVIDLGLLSRDDDLIRTTDAGVMMLNGVLRALLADRGSAA